MGGRCGWVDGGWTGKRLKGDWDVQVVKKREVVGQIDRWMQRNGSKKQDKFEQDGGETNRMNGWTLMTEGEKE